MVTEDRTSQAGGRAVDPESAPTATPTAVGEVPGSAATAARREHVARVIERGLVDGPAGNTLHEDCLNAADALEASGLTHVTISPLADTDSLLIARSLRFDGPVTFDGRLAGEITGCYFDRNPLPAVPHVEVG